MATPLDIIRMAMLDAGIGGIGETISDEEYQNAFTKLNWMIAELREERYMLYHLVTLSWTATGAASFTIGPGGDIERDFAPTEIKNAFVRTQGTGALPVDRQLTILYGMEDWNRITVKGLGSYPVCIFMDTGYPLSTVYCWPIPNADIYSIHMSVTMELPAFTNITEEVALPGVYESMLHANLALRLLTSSGDLQPPPPMLVAQAKYTKSLVRRRNAQIPRMRMPPGIPRGRIFNVLTGDTT